MTKIAPSLRSAASTTADASTKVEEVQRGPSMLEPTKAPVIVASADNTNHRRSSHKSTVGQQFLKLYNARVLTTLRHVVGFPYVLVTLVTSIIFLSTSRDTLQNDLFWAGFNATTGGVFVANAFNYVLLMQKAVHVTSSSSSASAGFDLQPEATQTFRLSNAEFASLDDMHDGTNSIGYSSLYPHFLRFHRLNTLEHALQGIRRTAPKRAAQLFAYQTQFCWVDLDRQFSLAHTARRAERCLADDQTKTNGAVYLETYLRNVDWATFFAEWGSSWTNGIEAPLRESIAGQAVLARIMNITQLPADQELSYWRSKGLSHFTMQWSTIYPSGVTEQISFASAMGLKSNFTIKNIVFASGSGKEGSLKMYWTPMNDLWAVGDDTTAISGMSLVRNTSSFYENANISMEQVMINDGLFPFPLTVKDTLVRGLLGPLGTIDMKQLLYPSSLVELWQTSQLVIKTTLLHDMKAQQDFYAIVARMDLEAFPFSWRNGGDSEWKFAGGNPLCSTGNYYEYLQIFISFTDACTGPYQVAVLAQRMYFVVAMIAMQPEGDVTQDFFEQLCAAGVQTTDDCVPQLTLAHEFITQRLAISDRQVIASLAGRAHQDIQAMSIELIQFAVNKSNNSQFELLHQPMFEDQLQHPWNLFGWFFCFDWLLQNREVIRLEGDDGTITLMSDRGSANFHEAKGSDVPANISVYFLRVVQYTTLISIACATLVFVYTISSRGRVAGSNLLKFNRVTGAVWIGRSLLIGRGIVAICMISTSQVFVHRHGRVTTMDETKSAWYNIIITAGESCWLSFVTADVMVAITQGYTYWYATLSSTIAQGVNAMLNFIHPFTHTMEVDLQCEFIVFYIQMNCHCGQVVIGSLTRFILVVVIAVGSVFASYWLTHALLKRAAPINGGRLLLAEIAREVFATEGWIHQDEWYVDKASAVLAGLVTIHFGNFSRVLDIKTWSLLHLRNSRLYDREPASASTKELPDRFKNAICLSMAIGDAPPPPPSSLSSFSCAGAGLRRASITKKLKMGPHQENFSQSATSAAVVDPKPKGCDRGCQTEDRA